jgi:hypothetical protein
MTRSGGAAGTAADHISHQSRQAFVLALQPVVFDRYVPALDVTGFANPLRNAAAKAHRHRPIRRNPTIGIAACCALAATAHPAALPSAGMGGGCNGAGSHRRSMFCCTA